MLNKGEAWVVYSSMDQGSGQESKMHMLVYYNCSKNACFQVSCIH